MAAAMVWSSTSVLAQEETPTVYFTKEITAESLVKIYEALGVTPTGKVAVKISTGESEKTGYLRPDFIKPLVDKVDGTIVECNTAYGGARSTTRNHRRAIKERGFTEENGFKTVDIMDEEGNLEIPVQDNKHLAYDIVGTHLANYDWMINLAHFKGHAMGGFGGVLKNQSIGVASKAGKLYIHSAGESTTSWGNPAQDDFLESMAAAAQAVHNYLKGQILYINVMNKLSVDCDCDGSPSKPKMNDVGILASLDPVALDKACLDIIFNYDSKSGDDASDLQKRINSLHGTHIVEYAEQIGLGTTSYKLIDLDQSSNLDTPVEIKAADIRKVIHSDGSIVLNDQYDALGRTIK